MEDRSGSKSEEKQLGGDPSGSKSEEKRPGGDPSGSKSEEEQPGGGPSGSKSEEEQPEGDPSASKSKEKQLGGDPSASKWKEKLGMACVNRLYGASYEREIDELRNHVLMMRFSKGKIKDTADAAKKAAEWPIEVYVADDWLSRAEKALKEASELIENGVAAEEKWDLVARCNFCGDAQQKRKELVELHEKLDSFRKGLEEAAGQQGNNNKTPGDTGSPESESPSACSDQEEEYALLSSQRKALDQIVEEYKKGNDIVELWGQMGVGKTTLAKRICDNLAKGTENVNELFARRILMVQATRNSDYGVIRAEIGYELAKKPKRFRAARRGRSSPQTSPENELKSILVIIDDFFHLNQKDGSPSAFDLEDIGPPPQGFKFRSLLISTSRIESDKATWTSIELGALPEPDGKNLFRKVADDADSNGELAELVVRKSRGLPFTIVAFAASIAVFPGPTGHVDYLDDKSFEVPGMALSLLGGSIPTELMNLLVICGKLANGAGPQVSIRDLAFEGMSVQEIANQHAEKIIERTNQAVRKLMACSLLHPGKFEGFVQVHDIVRLYAKELSERAKPKNPSN